MKEARWVRIWAAIALLTSACADTTGGAGDSGAEADADRDAGGGDSGSALDAGSEGGTVADAGTDGGASGSDASHAPDAAACPARPYLGFFVWNDDLVTTRDAILDLAQGAGVTEIYLHANLFYAGDETETTLAAWIDAAHARCIDVDLLFGNASWIHPAGRAQASARADWAVAFAAAHPGSRPTGVHFDLEPQQLAEWSDTTTHPALVSELVDTLTAIRPAADASGLVLSVDTGFFLDGVMVTRSGTTRPGSEWVTDAVTRLVVMDYRDSAASMGHGGMISLAQDEVDYAAAHGTPVVLSGQAHRNELPRKVWQWFLHGVVARSNRYSKTNCGISKCSWDGCISGLPPCQHGLARFSSTTTEFSKCRPPSEDSALASQLARRSRDAAGTRRDWIRSLPSSGGNAHAP